MVQFIANGVCNAAVYALVGVGFGLIFFAARTFHIAHGAVYTTAGFMTYGLLVPARLPLAVALAGGIAASVALGVLIELLAYYPLINPRRNRSASPAILMMSSLGVYIVIVNTIAMLAGNDTKVLRPGVEETIMLFGAILTRVQVAELLTAMLVLSGLGAALRFTHFGRTIRALADDSELASILGYNVRRIRLGVFALGSGLAGIGGILVALDIGINPQVGFAALLVAAVATIVGGFGRLMAPALGALILGVLQSMVVWKTSQKWASAVVFGVLIVTLLVRPYGLLAKKKRLEEV